MFERVLVANRGEIAVRVIRALHELGIEAVAVYSTADRDALHVRMADRAVHIGPPAATASYLSIPSVIAAATTTGCQAIHPGYGFLAENPALVEACVDNDLVFVGPPADVMAMMGDKISAKRAMREADVPTVPGTEGATTVATARTAAEEIGFPVLLKASAGGGGKGMRVVRDPSELEAALRGARAPAVLVIVGCVLGLAALPVLMVCLALVLVEAAGFTPAAAFAIVSGVSLAASAALVGIGWQRLRRQPLRAPRSREEWRQNWIWLKETVRRERAMRNEARRA